MIRIKFLFTGYWEPEEWEIYREVPLRVAQAEKTGPKGTRFYMRSKRTGWIKTIDIIN